MTRLCIDMRDISDPSTLRVKFLHALVQRELLTDQIAQSIVETFSEENGLPTPLLKEATELLQTVPVSRSTTFRRGHPLSLVYICIFTLATV